jgi:DNA repair protein RadA/Sms
MPKEKSVYICQACTYESTQWVGQCPNCLEWNTFVEEVVVPVKSGKSKRGKGEKGAGGRPIKLSKVGSKPPKRLSSNISEFDRVLGGGFVPGQVVLLAGEPGIGKSTLLTTLSKSLSGESKSRRNPKSTAKLTGASDILYVCGEESVEQVKLRVNRLGYKANNLLLLPETEVESIVAAMRNESGLSLVVVDSIQTVYSDRFSGLTGSMSQVRGAAQLLTNAAKETNTPLVLVGHVTKQGVVAGPKVLEHIVDTVLYLEGDAQHMYRLLRTNKNRFGPVSEVGVFEMSEEGMKEVKNPSKLFLGQKLDKSPGSCVTVVMEGFRPILFEVQALTVKTTFGYPKRTASGFNVNRLQVLIALLEKRCGLNLSNYDVYLNVAGGFKITEYAADLSVCMAIASSLNDKPIKDKTVVFGECGLSGEVRRVSHQDKRAKEAKKLGYSNVVSPDKVKSVMQALKASF